MEVAEVRVTGANLGPFFQRLSGEVVTELNQTIKISTLQQVLLLQRLQAEVPKGHLRGGVRFPAPPSSSQTHLPWRGDSLLRHVGIRLQIVQKSISQT